MPCPGGMPHPMSANNKITEYKTFGNTQLESRLTFTLITLTKLNRPLDSSTQPYQLWAFQDQVESEMTDFPIS